MKTKKETKAARLKREWIEETQRFQRMAGKKVSDWETLAKVYDSI